jgi:hypothetical protein
MCHTRPPQQVLLVYRTPRSLPIQRGPQGGACQWRACLIESGSTMEMDPTCLVGTAQCGGWGTGRMKLAQQAQRQRLRRDSMQAVGRHSPKIQDSTSRLEQDLNPGWGVLRFCSDHLCQLLGLGFCYAATCLLMYRTTVVNMTAESGCTRSTMFLCLSGFKQLCDC